MTSSDFHTSNAVRSTRNLEFKTTSIIFLVCNKSSCSKLGAPPLGVSVANSQAHYSIQSTIYQHLSDHQANVIVLLRAQGDHCMCVIHMLATRHWRPHQSIFQMLSFNRIYQATTPHGCTHQEDADPQMAPLVVSN